MEDTDLMVQGCLEECPEGCQDPATELTVHGALQITSQAMGQVTWAHKVTWVNQDQAPMAPTTKQPT